LSAYFPVEVYIVATFMNSTFNTMFKVEQKKI